MSVLVLCALCFDAAQTCCVPHMPVTWIQAVAGLWRSSLTSSCTRWPPRTELVAALPSPPTGSIVVPLAQPAVWWARNGGEPLAPNPVSQLGSVLKIQAGLGQVCERVATVYFFVSKFGLQATR